MFGLVNAFSIANRNAATSCNGKRKKKKKTHTFAYYAEARQGCAYQPHVGRFVASNGFFSCQFTHMLSPFFA